MSRIINSKEEEGDLEVVDDAEEAEVNKRLVELMVKEGSTKKKATAPRQKKKAALTDSLEAHKAPDAGSLPANTGTGGAPPPVTVPGVNNPQPTATNEGASTAEGAPTAEGAENSAITGPAAPPGYDDWSECVKLAHPYLASKDWGAEWEELVKLVVCYERFSNFPVSTLCSRSPAPLDMRYTTERKPSCELQATSRGIHRVDEERKAHEGLACG